MIGIIGGIGPLAGIDLFQKITEQTYAFSDQEHLPVLLYSTPGNIPDRTDFLEGKIQSNPGIALAKVCIELSNAGAEIIGVPCNTAHAPVIFNKMLELIEKLNCKMKIIHMVDETVEYIKYKIPQKQAIGILSTTGTYKQKIYYNRLLRDNYIPVIPDPDIQNLVHNSIYHPEYGIKTQNGKITRTAKSQLYDVMNIMKQQGAKAIILGCTEIPLAVQQTRYKNMILIDPSKILAKALIREYRKLHNQGL